MKDKFSKKYDSAIFLGDFNTCIFDNAMTSFFSLNDLASLIDQPTCYKNPEKPTCIDWFIDWLIDWLIDSIFTIRRDYFQQNNVFEISLIGFHMIIVTELNIGFE